MRDTATISPQAQAAPAAAQVIPAAAVELADTEQVRKPLAIPQRKIAVGSQDDPFEREAEATADRVMRMPEAPFVQGRYAQQVHSMLEGQTVPETPFIARKPSGDYPLQPPKRTFMEVSREVSGLQRKCTSCEDEEHDGMLQAKKTDTAAESVLPVAGKDDSRSESMSPVTLLAQFSASLPPSPSPSAEPCAVESEIQRKELEDEQLSKISLKSFDGGAAEAPDGLQSQLQQTRGSGDTLPESTRFFMEQSMGADFSGVSIHHDSAAAQMSSSVSAQAFTFGSDIYFNSGKYDTGSSQGKHLLAHELTHVVQQNTGLQRKLVQRKPADESQIHPEIDYLKAGDDNLDSWYKQYKFYNLFKELAIYPGSSPIAYANHVYELQLQLKEVSAGKWAIKEPGILESVIDSSSTLNRLIRIAIQHHNDTSISHGINSLLLERLYQYNAATEKDAPPLVSEYFKDIPQLAKVNRNRLFNIQLDDQGEYVTRLQLALLKLNYSLGEDLIFDLDAGRDVPSGSFGAGTRQAVIYFQQDSGFEGNDVDGIVGQMTLRLLDKRIGAPAFQRPSVVAGTAYEFAIPVTADDLLTDKDELKVSLLRRALKVAFPVTDEQVNKLVESGWRWEIYRDVTQPDVDLGYKSFTIAKPSYQSVMGKIREKVTNTAEEPVETKVGKQAIDLMKTGKLYELNTKINDHKGDNTELEALKKERQEELNRLGITLEEYETMKTDFIATFERFAVLIAFDMLAKSEMGARIETQHLRTDKEITELKSVLDDLAGKYSEAQKAWWEGVSLVDSGGTNKLLYRGAAEYYSSKNNGFYAGDVPIDGSDPKMYYEENNIKQRYEEHQKAPNAYFASWFVKEGAIVALLQKEAPTHPILATPQLELRRTAAQKAALDNDQLQKNLLGIIQGDDGKGGVMQNIIDTRAKLTSEPQKVWELPVVILRAQYSLGVIGGVPAQLIKEKQVEVGDTNFWENVGLAVVGIALGLVALASGPIGWLALAASLAVGTVDAYRTYMEITFKKQTANTDLDPAQALGTEDPSYFWFWVSLVSIGLDVAQAAKAIKAIAKGAELAGDTTKALREALIIKQASLASAGGTATESGKKILEEIQAIEAALAKVSTPEFAENIKFLEPLRSNPMAVVVMNNALADKKIVQAVKALSKAVDETTFIDVVQFYAGIGSKSLDELPELMRLVREGDLAKNKRLMSELLSDPRTQRVLLDTQDPSYIATQFSTWEAAIKAGESKSFVAFLEAEHLTSKLGSETRLADMFGKGFDALSNTVKNRYILRSIEPRLLDAFIADTLSPEIRRALNVLLNSDILAQSTRLSSGQERLLREIRLLGSVIETQSDFRKVIALLDNPTSRRALWEGAVQLAGKDTYVELILKASGGKMPPGDVLDDLIRIGPMTDEGTVQSLLTEAGAGLRKILANSPEVVLALKKCASPCLPPTVTADQVRRLAQVLRGKSRDDLLRIREFLYANREPASKFEAALMGMEHDFAEALKDIALPVLVIPKGLDISDMALRTILDHVPMSVLKKIMDNAATIPTGTQLIEQLMRVVQLAKYVPLNNFPKLLEGLSSTIRQEFRVAERLLNDADLFIQSSPGIFKYNGLQKGDVLLGRFSWPELSSLMSSKWSKNGFVNSLYDIIDKVPSATNDQIAELIAKAGGGKSPGNLERLREILSMTSSTTTYADAVKAIEAADAFAADVARALSDPATGFDAMVKLIWGASFKVENGVIKVTEALGTTTAYNTVFKLDHRQVLAQIVAGGGTINKEKWTVLRKVIDDSNIDQLTKNKIVGELWSSVNAEYYKRLGYTVYREVNVSGVGKTARVDLIIEKGNELIIVECKAGGGGYERGQKEIYAALEAGNFMSIMLETNLSIAAKYADPKTILSYILRKEAEIIR